VCVVTISSPNLSGRFDRPMRCGNGVITSVLRLEMCFFVRLSLFTIRGAGALHNGVSSRARYFCSTKTLLQTQLCVVIIFSESALRCQGKIFQYRKIIPIMLILGRKKVVIPGGGRGPVLGPLCMCRMFGKTGPQPALGITEASQYPTPPATTPGSPRRRDPSRVGARLCRLGSRTAAG
jgi:hypothetical protein